MSPVARAGKSKAQFEIESREREARALQMRRENADYGTIAAEIGWANESVARQAVQRALDRHTEPDANVLRMIEDSKLRELERIIREDVLAQEHIVVSFGKIMRHPDGTPVRDTAPIVAAVKELRQISERRAKLHGLDAPLRTIVEEITEDSVYAEIMRISAEADRIEADLAREQVRGSR